MGFLSGFSKVGVVKNYGLTIYFLNEWIKVQIKFKVFLEFIMMQKFVQNFNEFVKVKIFCAYRLLECISYIAK